MEGVVFAIGVVAAELALVAALILGVNLLREASKAPDAESRLAELEREEEELKRAA